MCNLPQLILNEVGQVKLVKICLQQVLRGDNLEKTGDKTN